MPDPQIYKVGAQSPDDPWRFVMSDPTPDSYGDIVEPSWKLAQFKRNPIALWMHKSDRPIGTWEDVRVEGGKLVGRLKLAARGTSQFIDELRDLVEQKILRSVSVGFRPGKMTPLDAEDPRAGYRMSDNLLLETSLVTVGANPNALNVRSPELRSYFTKSGDADCCTKGACDQLRARSPKPSESKSQQRGTAPMKLADRIEQKQSAVADFQTRSDDILARADTAGGMSEDLQAELDELTERMEKAQAELATLERLEQAQAGNQRPAPKAKADDAPAPKAPRIEMRQDRPAAFRAFATIGTLLKGYAEKTNPLDIVHREMRDEDGLDILVRAASAPALTGTSGWASQLVEQTWLDYLALLRDTSVYGQIPGQRLNLSAVSNMPIQAGRGNLAGGFIAENGAIPVKKGVVSSISLQPHKMAVISSYSREMVRRMTVADIGTYIRDQMLADTAEAIDTALLGSTARSAGTNPAGLQDTTETGAANVNAVTNSATGAGNATLAEIITDVNGLLGRANAIKVRTGSWVMNPKQVRALMTKQDATTGHFVFRDEIMQGRFYGMPIIESTNVTDGIVAFIGEQSMSFGSEHAPTFDESTDATLHFVDASATAIGTTGTPNTVAAPAYNLFQQDLLALKMTLGLDWRVTRQAGVQILTSATGW